MEDENCRKPPESVWASHLHVHASTWTSLLTTSTWLTPARARWWASSCGPISLTIRAARPSDTSSSLDFLAMTLRSTVAAPDVTVRSSVNCSPPPAEYAQRLVRILAAPTQTVSSLSASTRRPTMPGAASSIRSQLHGLCLCCRSCRARPCPWLDG